MSFSERLKYYLDAMGATPSQLADAAGLSRPNMSRYLSDKRVPDAAGDVPARIAAALAELSGGEGAGQALDYGVVLADLEAALAEGAPIDLAAFSQRLSDVLDTFGVARNRLALSMGFDPSYVSRIVAGQRRPADMARFVDETAAYIARNHSNVDGIALAADLTGAPAASLAEPHALAQAIRAYLGSGADLPRPSSAAMESFLEKLDGFDLGDYLNGIGFDELKVPTAPFQLPTTKVYQGIEEMKQAELDFLKAAVLSKSADDVILYSDMPLAEMAADKEFPKKVMMGMALLVRKGIRLRNIHDVHRPVDELFMGMEGWLPIYLMGLMDSYYLPHPTNDVFLHFIRSAGTAAVTGEAIAGNQAGGRYVVTKNAADVAYARRRAEELLAHAKPLVSVWLEDSQAELEKALRRLARKAQADPVTVGQGTFSNMTLTVWPGSHALIEKAHSPHVSLLVEHPALVDALEHYEPTLF